MSCVAFQADRLAKNPRECLKDLYRQVVNEAAYLSPIAITIFFESDLLSLE